MMSPKLRGEGECRKFCKCNLPSFRLHGCIDVDAPELRIEFWSFANYLCIRTIEMNYDAKM